MCTTDAFLFVARDGKIVRAVVNTNLLGANDSSLQQSL